MPTGFYFRFVAFVFTAILCVAMVHSWRADRRDRGQLAAELASTKQLLAAANARQHDRDAQLAQTLAALDAQKRATVTPDQIVHQLQKSIPLPAPIALHSTLSTPQSTDDRRGATYSAPASPTAEPGTASPTQMRDQPSQPQAVIPSADLKPLYDYTLDCQACQAKLSTAQNDLADERTKTTALTKERDDALHVAKGGSAWRRLGRAAKWFLLGAAAGAVVARAR